MKIVSFIVRSFIRLSSFLLEDTTNHTRKGNVRIAYKRPEQWYPLEGVQLSQWRKNQSITGLLRPFQGFVMMIDGYKTNKISRPVKHDNGNPYFKCYGLKFFFSEVITSYDTVSFWNGYIHLTNTMGIAIQLSRDSETVIVGSSS